MIKKKVLELKTIRKINSSGISIPLNSKPPLDAVENAFLPLNAYIPLALPGKSAEARLVLTEGTEVSEGQLIARGSGKGSVNVHSPIPGIVRRIFKNTMPGSQEKTMAVISLSGSFSISGRRPERYLWKSLNRSDILHIIQDKGVVSPAHGKSLHEMFTGFHGSSPVFVLNLLEMDPYRQSETEIARVRSHDLADAIAIACRIIQAQKAIFAHDASMDSSFHNELAMILAESKIETEEIGFRRVYPLDKPVQLHKSLQKHAKTGESIFILEPSALLAMHDAIVSNKAHIEQYVYIAGRAVKKQQLLKVRVGTPIGDLIEECGGFVGQPARIVLNSPFCGFSAGNLDVPVDRTTRAILVLDEKETQDAPIQPCSRCGKCINVCPEQLLPYYLYKLVTNNRTADALKAGLDRCIQCGACAWVCRSRLPMLEVFSQVLAEKV